MYACRRNRQRGPRACSVSVRQSMEDIDAALLSYIERELLTEEMLETVLADVRRETEKLALGGAQDVASLEDELRDLRAEQKRLAKAVALSDDIAELVSELKKRAQRVKHLEARLEAMPVT